MALLAGIFNGKGKGIQKKQILGKFREGEGRTIEGRTIYFVAEHTQLFSGPLMYGTHSSPPMFFFELTLVIYTEQATVLLSNNRQQPQQSFEHKLGMPRGLLETKVQLMPKK